MEKKTGIVNQASRVADIKTAIAKFDCKETNYNNDLDEISYIVSESGETIITRLRDKMSEHDSSWYLHTNGRFEISSHMVGYLPDLNFLSKCIVDLLKSC